MKNRSRVSGSLSTIIVALAVTLGPSAGHAAQLDSPKTTRELSALCSTPVTDQMHAAAVSYCIGFAEGAIAVQLRQQAASRRAKLFCIPDPPPSYVQARADFAAWVAANPAHAEDDPADGLFAYLVDRHPCPKGK
jgi:Rap1a immunity proteins